MWLLECLYLCGYRYHAGTTNAILNLMMFLMIVLVPLAQFVIVFAYIAATLLLSLPLLGCSGHSYCHCYSHGCCVCCVC